MANGSAHRVSLLDKGCPLIYRQLSGFNRVSGTPMKITRSGAAKKGDAALRSTGVAVVIAVAISCGATSALRAEETIEEIVVTGTRIARRDFESASPIVSVDAERFIEVGAPTVENVLNTMPQFVPAFTSSSNNPSNDGQANLSLRGLPVTSTLVLMDGRRVIPANGNGVVDVNMIPATLIDSVEVITGGASAVYGSDAVAGVVNFRLKKEFDGVEVGGFWGQTDRGDAAQWEANLTAGTEFAGGRGRVFGSVSHAEREQLNYDARRFSRYSLAYEGEGVGDLGPGNSFVSFGSGNIEEGRVRIFDLDPAAFEDVFAGYGFSPGTVPVSGFIGFNADRTLFSQGTGDPGSVANFRGDIDPIAFSDRFYTYNFAPDNALQLPLERTTAFAALRFDLTTDTELYAQGLYAEYSSDNQLAPTPAQFFMPPSNPYVPGDLKRITDSRPNPAAIFEFQKRLTELGPRRSINEYDVLQVTAGATGRVLDGWTWDAYLQYGENDQTKRQLNNALRSRIEELVFAADGGASLCGGFDPFGPGSISPECTDYIAADGSNVAGVEQFIAEASMTGALFALPAGQVRAAFGVMHKDDEYFYRADSVVRRFLEPDENVPFVRSDILGFNASDDVDGDDSNTDVYAEVSVPLLAGLPGVESLELVAGYRYSDYDSAGGVDAYKAELLYRIAAPVSVRASFQHAVRAPTIFELFLPQLPYDTVGIAPGQRQDPCRAGSPERTGANAAQIEALCIAQGVPAERLGDLAGDSISGVTGGNPDLLQEQADTYTFGIVFTSPSSSDLLADLQLSLDWFRIEVEDAVSEVFADEFVPNCFDPNFNPSFDPGNRWCTYFGRDPVSGDIVDAAEIYRNVAGITAEGVDLQLAWRFDAGPGQVRINWLLSWLDSFERLAAVGVEPVELAGTIGGSVGAALPQWKSLLQLGYDWNSVSATLHWRYVDSMHDADVPEFRIGSYDYFDFYASYEFASGALDGLSLRAGVVNLTDEAPPIYPTYVQANTDPSQYDPFGRRYTLGLAYRF
jgi:iron complex outermembrane receptor protein